MTSPVPKMPDDVSSKPDPALPVLPYQPGGDATAAPAQREHRQNGILAFVLGVAGTSIAGAMASAGGRLGLAECPACCACCFGAVAVVGSAKLACRVLAKGDLIARRWAAAALAFDVLVWVVVVALDQMRI